jgi:methylated-DNA-protein-cysteine methyltransferase-like protein
VTIEPAKIADDIEADMLNCGRMKTPLKSKTKGRASRGDARPGSAKERKASPVSAARRQQKILQTIAKIPHGKVSTYGAVAAAAGFSGRARLVARALHSSRSVPWQRVLGSGGAIKLQGEHAFEQRFRLQSEGVGFRGKKVDMKQHEHSWKKPRAR